MLDISASIGGEIQLTGRKLVVLTPGASRVAVASALAGTRAQMVVASDFGGAVPAEIMARADAILLDKIGVLIAGGPSTMAANTVAALEAAGHVLSVEDEGLVFALGAPPIDDEQRLYLRGYLAGVRELVSHLAEGEGAPEPARGARRTLGIEAIAGASKVGGGALEARMTWGLRAIGMDRSPFTGRGVGVAVLDSGIDQTNPDFQGRRIVSKSFVQGEAVQDGHGHGTHTAGTACGPMEPAGGVRYGVASEADLHVGKVLSNDGWGTDGGISAGINWALESGCRVISMSLGSERPPMETYRVIGERALNNGALIIAAAGNGSRRSQGRRAPIASPANAETIMAVAAVDEAGRVADFSSAGGIRYGNEPYVDTIDVAGPGVDVLSAWKMPEPYKRLQGTSMATPHVSGVAALMMEADPSANARQVWSRLKETAKRLDASVEDVGAGLVQAPVERVTPCSPPRVEGDGRVLEMGASDVLVTVKDGYIAQIQRIAAELRALGMVVKEVLPRIGTITGSATQDVLQKIIRVEGVAFVAKAGIYRLAPPESDIQ